MNTYSRCLLFCAVAFVASIVLLSTASAYDCSLAPLWWTMNSTTTDICGGYNATNVGMPYVAAVWDYGADAETVDSDNWYVADGAYETSGSRSWGVWVKPESIGADRAVMCKRTNDANFNLWTFQMTNNSFRCSCSKGATIYNIYSSSLAKVGNWSAVVCTYDSVAGNLSVYVNGSLENSVTGVTCNNATAGRLYLGCYSTDASCTSNYYDGVFDEAFYSNVSLTSAQVSNAFNYNNFSGPPGPESIGCNVSLLSPVTGSFSNDATPALSATITCYQDMADNCSLFMNSTASGLNSSLSNGTSFEVVANSSKSDGLYYWNFSCTNGSVTNSSGTNALFIETITPLINITSPLNFTYPYLTSTNLNFIYTEENPNTCFYSLNGAANTTIGYTNGTFLTFASGSHHVQLWCNDLAGNTNFSEVYFSIAGTPPPQPPECTGDTVFWVTANEATGNLTISCPSTAQTTAVPVGTSTPVRVSGVWNNASQTTGNYYGSNWQLDRYNLTGYGATVTAWYYMIGWNGVIVPFQGVVTKATANGTFNGALGVGMTNPTILPLDVVCFAGNQTVYANFTLSTMNWYFIGCRASNSSLTIWANETNVTIPFTHYFTDRTGHYAMLNLGDFVAGGVYSYQAKGVVDEATLWDIALSDEQVWNMFLYNNISGITPAPVYANCSAGVCGIVRDCANQTGLQGVSILVTQHNSTADFTFTTTTNASGYFNISGIVRNLTAQIVYTLDPYLSVEDEFIITETSLTWDGSTCLGVIGAPIHIDTMWTLTSNETSGVEDIYTHSDWKPNASYKKDALITDIQFIVYSGGETVTDLDLNGSVVTTTCSYAVTPSSYVMFELGEGRYAVLAVISGTPTQHLYAFCQDGAYFKIRFLGQGVNVQTYLEFQGYQMRASNVQLMVDSVALVNATFANYSWAYAFADFYQDTGENRNLVVNNMSCSARLEFYGSNITSWKTATINENHASVNFTTLASKPVVVQEHWNCTAPGFDYFDGIFTVSISEDAFTLARCWIADANGYELDWNKIGAQINHWCSFQTFDNASLLLMRVKSDNSNTNTERIFAYSYDQGNAWFFSTGLFYDDMPKGLNEWTVSLTSIPSLMAAPDLTYYQFVKVYATPPSKISPDYCDGTNCPKSLYKGETYFCKVRTSFEAEYTNLVAGIKLNETDVLYSIKPVDVVIDTVNHVHETSFSIAALGEKDHYGISSDTTIQCYFELYIDAEKIIYGETPAQMITKYRSSYPNDILGFQKGWNEFANQQDKTSWVFSKIAGIPAWFFNSIHVTDANGNINAVLLVVYLIAFALLIALAMVWTTRRR